MGNHWNSMGFPIDPIGAATPAITRDADLVAATRPVAGVASAAGRKGPGWPRVGARPLVKSTGSDHRKPQRNDFAVIFTEVDILYIFLYNMFGPGKWKMADLNRSVLNRCFMAAVD
jgi:hypothetical protein